MRRTGVAAVAVRWVVGVGLALGPASSHAQGNSPQQPAAARPALAKSPYWDKPLVLPPSPDELIAKLPPGTARWLSDWRAGQLQGRSASDRQIAELKRLFETEPLTAMRMAQIVHLIAFLDGNKTAVKLCGVVLNRATAELKAFEPPDPLAKPTVDALWPLHDILWAEQRWSANQRLLELLRPWEIYGSGHSQWASYVYAEVLYFKTDYSRAFDAYKDVVAERAAAFEPSEGINRALDVELGMSAFGARRYAEAVPYLQRAADNPSAVPRDAQTASASLCVALAEIGKRQEAIDRFKQYVRQYQLSRKDALHLAYSIQEAAAVEDE